MSDALQVFLSSKDIPNIDEFIINLKAQGLELEAWNDEIETLVDIDGFWPGKLKGVDAGFEFSIDEIDDDDLEAWDVEPRQLEGRDMMIELCYYTEDDLVASVVVIDFICSSCDGLTFDGNDELVVTASNLKKWKEEMLG